MSKTKLPAPFKGRFDHSAHQQVVRLKWSNSVISGFRTHSKLLAKYRSVRQTLQMAWGGCHPRDLQPSYLLRTHCECWEARRAWTWDGADGSQRLVLVLRSARNTKNIFMHVVVSDVCLSVLEYEIKVYIVLNMYVIFCHIWEGTNRLRLKQ